jgi:hypothetical protein
MKDRLEQFVEENREDFDVYLPDEKVFQRIKIPDTRKEFDLSIIWKVAAAIIVALPLSYMIYKGSTNKATIVLSESQSLPVELVEAEAYYTLQINSMKKDLVVLTASDPEVMREIDMDFSQLDSICVELKNEMKNETVSEEIVAAMIQNYRVKLEILNKLHTQLKSSEINNKKTYSYDL